MILIMLNGMHSAVYPSSCVQDMEIPSTYNIATRDFVIIAAAAGYPSNVPLFLYEVMRVALHISCIFLVLTIVVYLLLWKYQSFHGWTQFSYIVALLMFFIIQSVVNTFPELLQPEKNQGCFVLAINSSFALMAVYTTLLAMNIDIYLIFRCSELVDLDQKRRFICIQLAAWGIPILDICTGMLLDAVSTWPNRPQYGTEKCRQSSWNGAHYLCYIINALNLLFIVATLWEIICAYVRRLREPLTATNSRTFKKKLIKFLKLCLIMGLTWPSSLCALNIKITCAPEPFKWIVFVFAMSGNFQGIVIFLIFVCCKRTWNNLLKTYSPRSLHKKHSTNFLRRILVKGEN